MTRTRVRRKKADHRPGYIYVEVEVWEGAEVTGEPYDVWELPYTFRYSLDAAARLAVRQTRWRTDSAEPAPAPAVLPEGSWHPDDPEADQAEVTYTVEYQRAGDEAVVRLSGREKAGKLRAVAKAIETRTDQPVWLHVHRAGHGVREPWSDTMSMLFTIGRLRNIEIRQIDTVIEEVIG